MKGLAQIRRDEARRANRERGAEMLERCKKLVRDRDVCGPNEHYAEAINWLIDEYEETRGALGNAYVQLRSISGAAVRGMQLAEVRAPEEREARVCSCGRNRHEEGAEYCGACGGKLE
jgi:hypothetical protein